MAVAIELWANRLQNRSVIIFCDNQSVVGMINKMATPCVFCMKLIRHITLKSLKYNVRFYADYVNTKSNVLAAALSRLDFKRFWKNVNYEMNRYPTTLPQCLWPASNFLCN